MRNSSAPCMHIFSRSYPKDLIYSDDGESFVAEDC